MKPLVELAAAGTGLEVLEVAQNQRDEGGGFFAPARPGDVDFAGTAHAVPGEIGLDGVTGFRAALEVGQFIQKAVVIDVVQVPDDGRIGTNRIRDVQQRQAHFRGDVVRRGLGEPVGHVLLAQPFQHVVVDPRRRVHARHDRPEIMRVQIVLPRFREVGLDEVEERRPRMRPDILPEGLDRRRHARDLPRDDRRIVVEYRLIVRHRRALGAGTGFGRLGRSLLDEVPPLEEGHQGVFDERIRLAQHVDDDPALIRRRQVRRDVDEQPAAALIHGAPRRHLEDGPPQWFHRGGHHLAVPDGDEHVLVLVVGLRDGVQGRDRPALDDGEGIVDQAPFDVLGEPEMAFNLPAQASELHDLLIRQHRLLLLLRGDRPVLRPASLQGVDCQLLGGDLLLDDHVVTHLVHVRVHQPRDQGLAQAEAGIDGRHSPVARDGIGREQDAGRLRKDHPLNDDSQVDLTVVEAMLDAVGDRPLGEQRRPAPADVRQNRIFSDDVQVRVLLAREGRRRQILRRGAGPHGVGLGGSELRERLGDRLPDVPRHRGPFDDPPNLGAQLTNPGAVTDPETRQLIEQAADGRQFRHDPLERIRRHAKAVRHPDAVDAGQFSQVRAFAAHDLDGRLGDVLETEYVSAHRLASLGEA
ncbi:hypothetical protein D3C72_928420 [compost metagenome]